MKGLNWNSSNSPTQGPVLKNLKAEAVQQDVSFLSLSLGWLSEPHS